MYSEWNKGSKEGKSKALSCYHAVVVTVTVSVIVIGPFPSRGTGVMLGPLAVGADIAAGFGTAAVGVVEDVAMLVLAVGVPDDGVGCPGDDEGESLGNEITTGVCVGVVEGT